MHLLGLWLQYFEILQYLSMRFANSLLTVASVQRQMDWAPEAGSCADDRVVLVMQTQSAMNGLMLTVRLQQAQQAQPSSGRCSMPDLFMQSRMR